MELFFIPNTANGGPSVVYDEADELVSTLFFPLSSLYDDGGYGPSFDSFCNIKILQIKFQSIYISLLSSKYVVNASYLCLIPNEVHFRFAWCC